MTWPLTVSATGVGSARGEPLTVAAAVDVAVAVALGAGVAVADRLAAAVDGLGEAVVAAGPHAAATRMAASAAARNVIFDVATLLAAGLRSQLFLSFSTRYGCASFRSVA